MRSAATIIAGLVACLVSVVSTDGFAAGQSWQIDHATVTYTVHHPLKTASGTSKEIKGKGRCDQGKCQFLLATPVRSFDSGDSNRDLHMMEVTRGGQNPMVVVRTAFDETALARRLISLPFDIEFAGKRAGYRDVPCEAVNVDAQGAHVKCALVIKLSDFSITPPSLLAMSIKDEVPIAIDSFWKSSAK